MCRRLPDSRHDCLMHPTIFVVYTLPPPKHVSFVLLKVVSSLSSRVQKCKYVGKRTALSHTLPESLALIPQLVYFLFYSTPGIEFGFKVL